MMRHVALQAESQLCSSRIDVPDQTILPEKKIYIDASSALANQNAVLGTFVAVLGTVVNENSCPCHADEYCKFLLKRMGRTQLFTNFVFCSSHSISKVIPKFNDGENSRKVRVQPLR